MDSHGYQAIIVPVGPETKATPGYSPHGFKPSLPAWQLQPLFILGVSLHKLVYLMGQDQSAYLKMNEPIDSCSTWTRSKSSFKIHSCLQVNFTMTVSLLQQYCSSMHHCHLEERDLEGRAPEKHLLWCPAVMTAPMQQRVLKQVGTLHMWILPLNHKSNSQQNKPEESTDLQKTNPRIC